MYRKMPNNSNHPSPQFNLMLQYLELGVQPPWQIRLPVKSSVLYGEENEQWATNADHRTSEKRILTMSDLVAPQTVTFVHIELRSDYQKAKKPMTR